MSSGERRHAAVNEERPMSLLARASAVIGGLVIAVAAGRFCQVAVIFVTCDRPQASSDSGICKGVWRALLEPAEVALTIGAFVGPLVGGILAAAKSRWNWLWIGVAIAAACVFVVLVLTGSQETALG